jgi:Malectin domain
MPVFYLTDALTPAARGPGTGTYKVYIVPPADSSWNPTTEIITINTVYQQNQQNLYLSWNKTSFTYGDPDEQCVSCYYYDPIQGEYIYRQDLVRLALLPSTTPANIELKTQTFAAPTAVSSVKVAVAQEAVTGWTSTYSNQNYHGFTSGNSNTSYGTINAAAANSGPANMYKYSLYSPYIKYQSPVLQPNYTYTVRLHFSEPIYSTANQRLFNVSINGATTGSNYRSGMDIFTLAGARDRAYNTSFTGVALNSSNRIVVELTATKDSAIITGVEIIQGSSTGGTVTLQSTTSTNGTISVVRGKNFIPGTTKIIAYCQGTDMLRSTTATTQDFSVGARQLYLNAPSSTTFVGTAFQAPAVSWSYYSSTGNYISGSYLNSTATNAADFITPYGETFDYNDPATPETESVFTVEPINTDTPGSYKYNLINVPRAFETDTTIDSEIELNGTLTVSQKTSVTATLAITAPATMAASTTVSVPYTIQAQSVGLNTPVTFTLNGNATFSNGQKEITRTTHTAPLSVNLGASGTIQISGISDRLETSSTIYPQASSSITFTITGVPTVATVPTTSDLTAKFGASVPLVSGVYQVECNSTLSLPTVNSQGFPIRYRVTTDTTEATVNQTMLNVNTLTSTKDIEGTVVGDGQFTNNNFTFKVGAKTVAPMLQMTNITVYRPARDQIIAIPYVSKSAATFSTTSILGRISGDNIILTGDPGVITINGTVTASACYSAASTSSTLTVNNSSNIELIANPDAVTLIIPEGAPIAESTTLKFRVRATNGVPPKITLTLTKTGQGVVYTQTMTQSSDWTRQIPDGSATIYEKDVPQSVTTAGVHVWTGTLQYND